MPFVQQIVGVATLPGMRRAPLRLLSIPHVSVVCKVQGVAGQGVTIAAQISPPELFQHHLPV